MAFLLGMFWAVAAMLLAEAAPALPTNSTAVRLLTTGQPAVPSLAVRQHWADRVRLFASESIVGRPVVLLGDSLTENFAVARYFPGHLVVNRGISSDVIGNGLAPGDNRGVLQRLDCSMFPCQATDVFVLIGINDLGDRHGLDLMEQGYRDLLQRLRTLSPTTRIHVQSLLPTRGPYTRHNANIRAFNQRLRQLALVSHADYLDLHSQFVDDHDELKAGDTREGLHLNEAGYAVWSSAIKQAMGWD